MQIQVFLNAITMERLNMIIINELIEIAKIVYSKVRTNP